MGQRTPFGTYTNEPSVNTAELRAAKKLSLYGTTEPRYCCTSSGYPRIASEMAQKITPCFLSSSRNVVATETESNTASTATPASRYRSSLRLPKSFVHRKLRRRDQGEGESYRNYSGLST